MTDLLSAGPEQPRAAGKVVVACLAVLAVVALIVSSSGRHATKTPAPVAISRTPAVLRTDLLPSPAPTTATPVIEPSLVGVDAAAPDGTVLLVGGPHPTAIGGKADAFARLPLRAGDAVSRILPVRGGYVVQVTHGGYVAGRASATIYRVDDDGSVHLIIAADSVILDASGDRLLAIRDGSTQANIQASQLYGTLYEVTLAGRIVASHPVTPDFDTLVDTAHGLLTATYPAQIGQPTQLRLVDPQTLAVRDDLGQVQDLVVSGHWAAWTRPGCNDPCTLTLDDLATGRRHSLALPVGWALGSVAISTDGSRVALSYLGREATVLGPAAPGYVEVAELTDGSRQQVPGIGTAVGVAASLAWTPAGDLAIGVDYPATGERRIGVWPSGGGPVHVLPGSWPAGALPSTLVAL